MSDTLDVVGHREQIESTQVLELIALFGKSSQVSCQSRWVAGDVRNCPRTTPCDLAHDLGFRARTRRIEHDNVDLIVVPPRQHVIHPTAHDIDHRQITQISPGVLHCLPCPLHSDHRTVVPDVIGDSAGKQPHTCVQVQAPLPWLWRQGIQNGTDQYLGSAWVHLPEASTRDAPKPAGGRLCDEPIARLTVNKLSAGEVYDDPYWDVVSQTLAESGRYVTQVPNFGPFRQMVADAVNVAISEEDVDIDQLMEDLNEQAAAELEAQGVLAS